MDEEESEVDGKVYAEDIDSATIEDEEDDEADATVEQEPNVSTEVSLASVIDLDLMFIR